MKINKLEYIGLLLQESLARPGLNALARLLAMHARQLDPAEYETMPNGAEMCALQHLIILPAEAVRYGLTAPKRNYVFTASAQEVITNIRVTKHLTPDRIQRIKSRVYCLNFEKGYAAFVWKSGDDLHMIYTWNDQSAASSGIAAVSMASMFDLVDAFRDDEAMTAQTSGLLRGIEDVWRRVLQTLIFLELTDPEIEFVPAGKKHSQRPFGTSNTSRQDVYVVSSTWNKYIIRTEGWAVRGHFRMQLVGVGRSELKLVWVAPYQKSGVIRKPQNPEA